MYTKGAQDGNSHAMTSQLILKTSVLEEVQQKTKGRLKAFLKQTQGQPGFVFGLLCVQGRPALAELVVNTILEEMERAAETLRETSNTQHRFEQILEAVNERVATLAPELEPTLMSTDVNAIVGVAVGDVMYLSGSGDFTALFLHKTEDQRYQVFNLSRSIQTGASKPSWEKMFGVVLDGDLHSGDIFCICNRPLDQELPPEELNNVLTTLPPAGAVAKIRQYFPIDVDLAMVLLKAQLPEETPFSPARSQRPERASAASSLSQLEHTQEKTQRVLADQRPRINIPGLSSLHGFLRTHRHVLRRSAVSVSRLLFSVIIVGGKMILGILSSLFSVTKKMAGSERREMLGQARGTADAVISRVLRVFNRLPKTSKYLILAAVVLVFVFVSSTMVLSRSHVQQENRAAFTASVKAVEEVRDQASGAIIYKDETQARTLLLQAFRALSEIHADTPEEQAEIDRLEKELTLMQDQLRHVVNIPDPPLVVDLSTAGAVAMSLEADELLVFANDRSVYRVDQQTRTASRIEVDTSLAGVVKEADSEDGEVYFLDDRPGLAVYADNVLTNTDTIPQENERWVDLSAYANRVYVLNPGGGGAEPQILRFSRTESGFGAAAAWIRARTADLSDAVSLAVDGTVFVLKQNGSIIRFTSGSEVSWNQGTVDPPLSAPTDLWTAFESDHLYVLEPSTQRLIVFEKETGNFVTQYRSDAFVGLTDFVVDETHKTIYLLAGSRVYRMDASHL